MKIAYMDENKFGISDKAVIDKYGYLKYVGFTGFDGAKFVQDDLITFSTSGKAMELSDAQYDALLFGFQKMAKLKDMQKEAIKMLFDNKKSKKTKELCVVQSI